MSHSQLAQRQVLLLFVSTLRDSAQHANAGFTCAPGVGCVPAASLLGSKTGALNPEPRQTYIDMFSSKCSERTQADREEGISFKQIAAFLAVAQTSNIAVAARQIHMTQSGLYRAIASLEIFVSHNLFERTARGLVLTAFGADFMPYARKLRDCYESLLLPAPDAEPRQPVVAGCDLVLPALVQTLLRAMPAGLNTNAAMHFNALPSHQVVQAVANHKAEVGVCVRGPDVSGLDFLPVLQGPIGLLVPLQSTFPGQINRLEDLTSLRMVRLSDELALPQFLRAHGVQLESYFNTATVSNSVATVIAAVRSGHYATLVSAFSASIGGGDLRFVPLTHLLPPMQLCVVTRVDNFSRNAALIETITISLGRLPWLACVQPMPCPAADAAAQASN